MESCCLAPQSPAPVRRAKPLSPPPPIADPVTGMIPMPRSRPTRSRPEGSSLEFYTRNEKARAMARVDKLPRRQCYRSVLRFLIQVGNGPECESWWSARRIAEELPKSGLGSYSPYHVQRELVLMEFDGVTRSRRVTPGEQFPDGIEATFGGCVRKVNVAALLGKSPVWPSPRRRVRGLPASAFADVEATDGEAAAEAAAAAAAFRGMVGLEQLDQEQPETPAEELLAELEQQPEPAAPAPVDEAPADVSEKVPEGSPTTSDARPSIDHPCSGAIDHPCFTDLGSPTENLNLDPERSALASRESEDAASRAGDSHARASRAQVASETPPSAPAIRASHNGDRSERESWEGNEEQAARHRESRRRRVVVGPPATPPTLVASQLEQLYLQLRPREGTS